MRGSLSSGFSRVSAIGASMRDDCCEYGMVCVCVCVWQSTQLSFLCLRTGLNFISFVSGLPGTKGEKGDIGVGIAGENGLPGPPGRRTQSLRP